MGEPQPTPQHYTRSESKYRCGRCSVGTKASVRIRQAQGQLRNRTLYASATSVAAGTNPVVRSNSLPPTTIDEKRSRSQGDHGDDFQRHPRRMGNSAEGVSHTSMRPPTSGTRAASPDTSISHDDDVVSGVSPHGTCDSLAHRAALVVVGIAKEEHEKMLLDLSGLRKRLGKTQSALDATQFRVYALESVQTRLEAQLDLLVRIQQPMAMPSFAVQAPPNSCGTDPMRLKKVNVEHRMCAQFARKAERKRKSLLSDDRKWFKEARTQLCLEGGGHYIGR